MSGPIIRSAPSSKFTDNWSQVFGGAEAPVGKKAAKKTAAKAKPAAKAKAAPKAATKAAPKAKKKKS